MLRLRIDQSLNRLALIGAALLLPLLTNAAPQPMMLEDVMAIKQVNQVRMSPNGSQIAYLLSVSRELYVEADGPAHQELHVVDLAGNSRAYVTDRIDLSTVVWSANGKSVYFVAKRDPEADFNSLYQIDLAGGEARHLFTHVNDISSVFPSPDGKTLAFTAPEAPPTAQPALAEKGFRANVYEESVPNVHVWLLDLASGEAAQQELDGSASVLVWSPDGNNYAVALAPSPLIDDSFTSQDIHVIDTNSGKDLARMGSAGKLGHFAFSPDGERIAYIAGEDINDPSPGRLYIASVTGGERRELVPEYAGQVEHFVWRDDVTVQWLGSRGVWHEWQSASVMSPQTPGDAPDSGVIIRTVDGHVGQTAIAAIADSPLHPREVYLLRDGQAPQRLTDSNPQLADIALARQEVINYEARDGLTLQGLLVHPLKKPRGRVPLVIFVHGGPEAHDMNGWLTAYSKPAQVFAGDGYAVFYPNYRGSTGRGVEFSKLGQQDYAEEEFNDIVDAKRHLVADGLVDGDRVGISGGSYGGYATLWSASALTEEYAAAVAFVGISNQISKFGTGDIPYEMYHVHSRVWPWDDWMWMLERSPVFHAGKTKTPLLIMTGDSDPRVHPSQSLEMYRSVKIRTETPVRLVFYPDEGHGNRNSAAQYDYSIRLKRWMDHYLKGPGGEAPPYEIDHAAKLPE